MDLTNSPVIVLNPADNVAVARLALQPGASTGLGLTASGLIPQGHKIAVEPISAGQPVRKYGQIIGLATCDIAAGEHVHVHNVAMDEGSRSHEYCVDAAPTAFVPEAERATFNGYRREDGRVGTRNYIAVISSVTCSATVSRAVANHFNREGGLAGFDNVDGVVPLTHGGGCSINGYGEGFAYLERTLAGYARHPNIGGVVMIGLGCETNQIPHLMQSFGLKESPTFRAMTIQGSGGTRKTIDMACEAIREMLPLVNAAQRTRQSAAGLVLALECGGSDGYSGVSANPALGYAADLLVRNGGTVVLSETPEIYGAEHLLTRRAVSADVAEKLLTRIAWWKDYVSRNKADLNNNPSHGNKAGGLTTILEKSLGAVTKSGSTALTGVYEYAERIDSKGFVFMDTPGNDAVAVTGQVAGGSNLICFTTGRGSTAGFKPSPCIKLASNNAMYERMRDDMDLNCGTIVSGDESIEDVGRRIFTKILDIASGAQTLSESYDYGESEFVPWQVGATM
ncbi:MAG TPA: altronate dehydratase family protein [Roseiarcus sp.]|jgi:galactarate dehydratase